MNKLLKFPLIIYYLFLSVNLFAQAGIIISIPDKNFKTALIASGVDKNHDGEIQKTAEAALVTEINVYGEDISSLEGIEHFENLSVLNCAKNKLTALDLTKNTKLTKVFCKENTIKSLDVSHCPNLEDLTCTSNELTTLDVSANKYLKTLECAVNQLTSLDVSWHKHLTWLDCSWNKLTSLNVSYCDNLETMHCENNSLIQVVTSPSQYYRVRWIKDAATEWGK